MDEVKRGPGFWKLNCSLLSDIDYINLINARIQETKDTYANDPYVDEQLLWEMMKCNVRAETIQYAARKKRKERNLLCTLEHDI